MPKQNNHRPPMKKGVLRRLLGMLFRFYPVLLPIAIVCIVFAAIASTIPAIFLQRVTEMIEVAQSNGDSWE